MENYIHVFITLFFAGAAVLSCLILGFILVAKRSSISNLYFGILLIMGGLTLTNSLMANTGILSTFKNLYFLPIYYTWWFSPLIYLIIRTKLVSSESYSKKNLLHLVIPSIQTVFYFSVGFRSYEFKSWLYNEVISVWLGTFGNVVNFALIVIYGILSKKLLYDYRATAEWQETRNKWLNQLINGYLVLISIEFIYTLIDIVLTSQFQINLFNVSWASFPLDLSRSLIWLWLAWNGLKVWFPEHIYRTKAELEINVKREKESNQDLFSQLNALKQLIEEQKLYLNPDLTLSVLAETVSRSEKEVSLLINEGLGKNYNDFINSYRVEEVKFRLVQPEFSHQTILSIALDSGFNSKATFNRVFKIMTGLNPSEYAKKALELKSQKK